MGSTIARNAAFVLLIAAVPVVFAIPVATCDPVGGELPGINCLPGFALAVLGPAVFAFVLGMMVAGRRRSGGRRPAIRAMAALAGGGLVVLGLPHDVALRDPWVFYSSLPVTVLGPWIAFAIGWPLGSWLGRVIRAGGGPPPTDGDTTAARGEATRAGGSGQTPGANAAPGRPARLPPSEESGTHRALPGAVVTDDRV